MEAWTNHSTTRLLKHLESLVKSLETIAKNTEPVVSIPTVWTYPTEPTFDGRWVWIDGQEADAENTDDNEKEE